MASLLDAFIRGGQAGRQAYENRHEDERESALGKLAGQAYSTPKEGQNALLAKMAPYSPQMAAQQQSAFQGQEDRTRTRVAGAAKYMLEAYKSGDPNRIKGAYSAVTPILAEVGASQGKVPPPEFQEDMLPHLYQLVGESGGAVSNNPYSDQPSDIQSLRILQENPELLKLDKERRTYSGMVPKPFETSQGIGWGTPGGGIRLAPIDGAADPSGNAPPNQSAPRFTGPDGVPVDVSGVTDPAVRNSIMQNPGGWNAAPDGSTAQLPPQQIGAPSPGGNSNIAQPFTKPDAPPTGYERLPNGDLRYVKGGPADPAVIAQRPLDPAKAMKLEQSKRKETAMLTSAEADIQETIDLVDELIAERGKFKGVTGMGSWGAKVPGSPWANTNAKLETLKAKSAFGSLQEMRANSPTGGALGSVTERELQLLQNAETQLQNTQSPEALEAALRKYRKALADSKLRMRRGVEEFYQQEEGSSPGTPQAPNPQIDSLLEKYR